MLLQNRAKSKRNKLFPINYEDRNKANKCKFLSTGLGKSLEQFSKTEALGPYISGILTNV